MNMQGRLSALGGAMAMLALAAAPIGAQQTSGKAQLYVGYTFFRAVGGNLSGLRLSPEFRLNGPAALVADLSVEKGTITKASTTVSTFLGGVRLKKAIGSAAIYVHALAGGVRASSSITPFSGVSISVSDTGLGLDGGGGVEFNFRGSVKMRVGADYLRRKIDAGGGKRSDENDVRATVGLVF